MAGFSFLRFFSATKHSVNRKYYSIIFSIADKTELNMEIAGRQALIDQLVGEMLDEGALNDQFQLIQATRAAGDLQIVAKMIHLYCIEIETGLIVIANYLTKPNVDYAGMSVRAGQLGLCSCSIGANYMLKLFGLFMHVCARGHMEECVRAFNKLYRECSHFRTKFMEILQLEVQIFLRRQQS